MSNAVFPTFIGLTWDGAKRIIGGNTIIQTAASLQETRVALVPYPLFEYDLTFDFLADGPYNNTDLRTLIGFFMARQGAFDSFLLDDKSDDLVTAQPVGIGDGATKDFQLVRTYGNFAAPIYDIKASAPTPLVYLGGVLQGSGYTIGSTGILSFTVAPTLGVAITATFGFYWRVRFKEDTAEFKQFVTNIWEGHKLTLRVVKP